MSTLSDQAQKVIDSVVEQLQTQGEQLLKQEMANFAKPMAAALLAAAKDDSGELILIAQDVMAGTISPEDAAQEVGLVAALALTQALNELRVTRQELYAIRKTATTAFVSIFTGALKAVIP